jgi:hypothetical protein
MKNSISVKEAAKRIAKLKKMTRFSLEGFEGDDATTKEINRLLTTTYLPLCTAYNAAHAYLLTKEKK